jgi:hypothetical protein
VTAALVLAWKFDNGASQIHEFCAEPGEMSVLVREVAACMEIVDGGAALWRGVAGDLQAQVLQLKAELREANDSLSFWLEKTYPVGAMA